MLTYFDSHAHLTNEMLVDQCDLLVESAKNAGVQHIVNICTDRQTLEKGVLLAKRWPGVYTAAATTPHDVEKEGERLFPLMVKHGHNGDLVAVGETGLDYYYEHSHKQVQKEFLKRYLALALECHLPVIIHCRHAFEDFFSILDAEYRTSEGWSPGVLHCFTGTIDEAEEVLKRGWYLSLSGIVTFKKSAELREIAKRVPLGQLLIETDSPYLAPQSQRGKVNQPAYLPEIAQVIAQVKGVAVEEVAAHTVANAKKLFKITN